MGIAPVRLVPVGDSFVPSLLLSQLDDRALTCRVLDRLQLEVVVLDRDRTIAFCNESARRSIAARQIVGESPGGRLYFVDPAMERNFSSLLRRLEEIGSDQGGTLAVSGDGGLPQRSVSIRLLDDDSEAGGRLTLVTLAALESSPRKERMAEVMQSFGLTKAERRLTESLVAGSRLDDAARKFGLSVHTVRNQLRAVFDKVGVRRQADLLQQIHQRCSYG